MPTITFSLNEINTVAKELLTKYAEYPIWLLQGDMGTGKTTFTKAVCNILKVTDLVSSPTYGLMNIYNTASNNEIYHFDLYRINDLQEALNIGIEDFLRSGNLCIIEWPTNILSLISGKHLILSFSMNDSQSRTIEIQSYDE